MSAGSEPAFPFEGGQNNGNQPYCGMTLRDWFAGMAMQGMLSSADISDGPNDEALAKWAYMAADAMLAEREKGA